MTRDRFQAVLTLLLSIAVSSLSISLGLAQEGEEGYSVLPCQDTNPATCIDDGLFNCTPASANTVCNTTQYTVPCICQPVNGGPNKGCRCVKP